MGRVAWYGTQASRARGDVSSSTSLTRALQLKLACNGRRISLQRLSVIDRITLGGEVGQLQSDRSS